MSTPEPRTPLGWSKVLGVTALVLISGVVLYEVGAFLGLTRDLDPRPASRVTGVEELASQLDEGGIDCTLTERDEVLPEGRETWGACADPDHPMGMGHSVTFAVYDDEEAYEGRLDEARTGCGGPRVFGPNWWVNPLPPTDEEDVLNAVGGRVVGTEETRDC